MSIEYKNKIEERIIEIRTVDENLYQIRVDGQLTVSLRKLKKNYNFTKRYNNWCKVKDTKKRREERRLFCRYCNKEFNPRLSERYCSAQCRRLQNNKFNREKYWENKSNSQSIERGIEN